MALPCGRPDIGPRMSPGAAFGRSAWMRLASAASRPCVVAGSVAGAHGNPDSADRWRLTYEATVLANASSIVPCAADNAGCNRLMTVTTDRRSPFHAEHRQRKLCGSHAGTVTVI